MTTLLFTFPEQKDLANNIAKRLKCQQGEMILRKFPDQETYLRILTEVKNRDVILICSLDKSNEKFLPLLFFAETVRELGANKITLMAPYLSYMRQDKRFQEGEAITSRIFAKVLSQHFDRLITIDPHLHRYHSLSEIYSIPTQVLHANGLIAKWIKTHITQPLIIGPDMESEQWVSVIAKELAAPMVVLQKTRHGDKSVTVSIPSISEYKTHTPVLVDDIISSGVTMIEAVKQLHAIKSFPPVCIAVHGIFANDSYQDLLQAGVAQLVTCNSIPHATNHIDVSSLLAVAL